MIKQLCLLLVLLLSPSCMMAQIEDKPYMTWDEFVQTYYEGENGEEDESLLEEQRERLQVLMQHPMQINRLSRSDLLQLPFIDETQADSILSYREKRHGFLSLGELMLVNGMDYFTRSYLSLFVRCDSAMLQSEAYVQRMREQDRLIAKLVRGTHEVETRLNIPLYSCAGYKDVDNPTATNYYTGNALHHVVRYRYHYKREVLYGLTFEKDAGEPVAVRGFYPYDYISGYVLLRPRGKKWRVVMGDYDLQGGYGLLYGRQVYGNKAQALSKVSGNVTTFRAHTSTQESDFFRGLAASYCSKGWQMMAFVSYRKLDGRTQAGTDTVRTILTTGLHRTLSEINSRRTLGCLTSGVQIVYSKKQWGIGLDGYVAHFNSVVWPKVQIYNRHYFRGRTAGNVAANYYVSQRRWNCQGDIAFDANGHIATQQSLSWNVGTKLNIGAQYRQFSPRFVSLYGKAIQQNTRVANEQGLLATVRYLPQKKLELSGYLDVFRFPCPTFNSRFDNAKGIEGMLQSLAQIGAGWQLMARYQIRSKQQTYNYKSLVLKEYVMRHKIRLSSLFKATRGDVAVQLDAAYTAKQRGTSSKGIMASCRGSYKASKRVTAKAFMGIFFTDDTDSQLYVYEPQLLYTSSFNGYAYHGMRGVLLCSWQVLKSVALSVRASSIHYFNKSSISSRLDLISSSWKNDLALQLRWIL